MKAVRPVIERLMERVLPEPMSGCWIWMGSVGQRGYGHIGTVYHSAKATRDVHVVAFEHAFGPVAHGTMIKHKCHTRLCVNPHHLTAVAARPVIERLLDWAIPEPMSGCWLWVGTVVKSGYGHIRCGDKVRGAHVVSYEHFVGPVPEGLHLDHLCRVRCCVNPQHLEAVTCKENIRRGLRGPRKYCPRGHPYDAINTGVQLIRGKHWRYCLPCRRMLDRARLARLRAASRGTQ
jgi:hypothetical protein